MNKLEKAEEKTRIEKSFDSPDKSFTWMKSKSDNVDGVDIIFTSGDPIFLLLLSLRKIGGCVSKNNILLNNYMKIQK